MVDSPGPRVRAGDVDGDYRMGGVMAATRVTRADLERALTACQKVGQAIGEIVIQADGSIRIRPPETVDTKRPDTQKPGLESW